MKITTEHKCFLTKCVNILRFELVKGKSVAVTLVDREYDSYQEELGAVRNMCNSVVYLIESMLEKGK